MSGPEALGLAPTIGPRRDEPLPRSRESTRIPAREHLGPGGTARLGRNFRPRALRATKSIRSGVAAAPPIPRRVATARGQDQNESRIPALT
jgi:hypothetical protein